MVPKTKNKKIHVVLGSLTGGLITAALSGFVCWVSVYTEDSNLFLHEYAEFLALIFGGGGGFIAGALGGGFLSLKRGGPLFGALGGAVGGLAILLFLLIGLGGPSGDTRIDLTLAAFVPIGAISGLLTSLILSAMTSAPEDKPHWYGVLGLEQTETDESRP